MPSPTPANQTVKATGDGRTKPGPKPGAKAAATTKPAVTKAATEAKPTAPATEQDKGPAEVSALRKVFLETVACSLIYDIFQLHAALHALAHVPQEELDYFVKYYGDRLTTLLLNDREHDRIGALLDVGAWSVLDGQEEVLTEAILKHLGQAVVPTNQQLMQLLAEATFGRRKDERTSRGETWMPARHRAGSREDVARCAPRHLSDNAHERRS